MNPLMFATPHTQFLIGEVMAEFIDKVSQEIVLLRNGQIPPVRDEMNAFIAQTRPKFPESGEGFDDAMDDKVREIMSRYDRRHL